MFTYSGLDIRRQKSFVDAGHLLVRSCLLAKQVSKPGEVWDGGTRRGHNDYKSAKPR